MTQFINLQLMVRIFYFFICFSINALQLPLFFFLVISVCDLGNVNQYSWFWKSLNMAFPKVFIQELI